MPAQIDFLPIAAVDSSLVDTQANFAGSGYQVNGFSPGITLPAQFNKSLRQGSTWGAVLANFVSATLGGVNVLDQGYANPAAEVAALVAQFESALLAFVSSTITPTVVVVAFSATPSFNCAAANPLHAVFEITLTGNVTSSAIAGQHPGQDVTFIIKQDGTGGHTFSWPAGVNNFGAPDPTAGSTSTQRGVTDAESHVQAESTIVG